MYNIYFKGLLIFTASVITLASFAQVRGPYDRACDPIPTKDGIAITPEVKVPPMTEAQRQAHFIKVERENKSMSPTMCNDLIVDGGFETGGIPSTLWDPETSTNFGTPVCNWMGHRSSA
jgi:hypothetical protein